MSRRSVRLENAGYYDSDGSPRTSYTSVTRRHTWPQEKARPARVSQPAQRRAPLWRAELVPRTEPAPRSGRWFSWSWNKVLAFLVSLLGFGLTIYSEAKVYRLRTEVQSLHLELARLQTRMSPKAIFKGNFALDAHGAQILTALSSKTHQQKDPPPGLKQFTARDVIKGSNYPLTPGHCWAVSGQTGVLFVALSQKIHLSHVTLGHISKGQSVTGEILSAPKTFSIYGREELDGPAVRLGTFQYQADGESFQTFEIPEYPKVVRFVALEVQSNHGHEEYTCLYNFRVHGKVPEAASPTNE
ncbi:unnamed protein product [Knipowitschia caucasica]|uniref:SUN domain-containing protein n=1 Tax=Knipowitschia caucasica TaxID=637954 RepID=A0AAV2KNC7_KNICA